MSCCTVVYAYVLICCHQAAGAGSFGSVHAGMWLGAPVAIKYLQSTSGTADNSSLREQLRQEVLLQVHY